MLALGYDPDDATTDRNTAAGVGNRAAAAMLAYCHTDGANQLGDRHPSGVPYADYTGYAPRNPWEEVNEPNRWQPLRVPTATGDGFIIQRFVAPHWNRVTPFALASADQFRAPPPALFSHGSYRAQAEELIHLSARLTDREKVIAKYGRMRDARVAAQCREVLLLHGAAPAGSGSTEPPQSGAYAGATAQRA